MIETVRAPVAVQNGRILFSTDDSGGVTRGYDTSLALIGEWFIGVETFAPPTMFNGKVVSLSNSGALSINDAGAGGIIQSFMFPAEWPAFSDEAIIADGQIIFRSDDSGFLRIIEPQAGKPQNVQVTTFCGAPVKNRITWDEPIVGRRPFTYKVYRIDPAAPDVVPPAIASGITVRTYDDSTAVLGQSYIYAAVWRAPKWLQPGRGRRLATSA